MHKGGVGENMRLDNCRHGGENTATRYKKTRLQSLDKFGQAVDQLLPDASRSQHVFTAVGPEEHGLTAVGPGENGSASQQPVCNTAERELNLQMKTLLDLTDSLGLARSESSEDAQDGRPCSESIPVRSERPKSFLRDEMDEFERIFSELLFPQSNQPMTTVSEEEADEEDDTDIMDRLMKGRGKSPGGDHVKRRSPQQRSPRDGIVRGASFPTHSPTSVCSNEGASKSPCSHHGASKAACSHHGATATSGHYPSVGRSRSFQETSTTAGRPSRDSGLFETEDGTSLSRLEGIWNDNDQLFGQLLDDLDNITGNTPSVRRRRRARDLFSDWLFSNNHEKKAAGGGGAVPTAPAPSPSTPQHCSSTPGLTQTSPPGSGATEAAQLGKPRLRRSKVKEMFSDFTARRRSADYLLSGGGKMEHTRWRPKSFEYHSEEDDVDSGYHTASSTLQGAGASTQGAIRPSPGYFTLTREELRHKIVSFNDNNHGLIMNLDSSQNTFQGFIRVYMNLIRPINMSISTRPPSIYEVLAHEEPDEPEDSEITSFYLPKDTTKVIHISSDTTVQEVIRALLQKFRITDNPRKFALYEKLHHEDGKKGVMRKLQEEERPLQLCLGWTAQGLDHRRFVLQENDTGEIMWENFSIPELENFLKILDREEEEYIEQLKAKYQLLKIQMQRRVDELDKEHEKQEKEAFKKDKREPVFV